MQFRTEYIAKPSKIRISHSDKIFMSGSCFTDNIGTKLLQSGFNVLANPFGPFFNPVSIAQLLSQKPSLIIDYGDRSHCLDLPSRFQSPKSEKNSLIERIDEKYSSMRQFIESASIAIITLGSAHVYTHLKSGSIVANCHKLPAFEFEQNRLSVEQCVKELRSIISSLKNYGVKTVIFTISPVHHLDRGVEGNFINKATLRLAVEQVIGDDVLYFPAFEIVSDDLRDYRFYTEDMKHPSIIAVDYIYSKFEETFFSRQTREEAATCFKRWQREQHRQLITE